MPPMGRNRRRDERGVALPTAIVVALMVSVTAVALLNFVMARFELSAQRSDHSISRLSCEAGFQYAFTRLDNDPAFEDAVRNDNNGRLVSPLDVGTRIWFPYDGGRRRIRVDQQEPRLRMGWGGAASPLHHVHVLIEEFPENPPVNPPRLRIHAYSDFGTGQ